MDSLGPKLQVSRRCLPRAARRPPRRRRLVACRPAPRPPLQLLPSGWTPLSLVNGAGNAALVAGVRISGVRRRLACGAGGAGGQVRRSALRAPGQAAGLAGAGPAGATCFSTHSSGNWRGWLIRQAIAAGLAR